MMEEAKMGVNAYTDGDPSVGIQGQSFSFEFPLCMLDGDDDDSLREEIRDRFHDLVQALADERPTVWFSDECPDCLQRLGEDEICHNRSCPSYLEE